MTDPGPEQHRGTEKEEDQRPASYRQDFPSWEYSVPW